MVFVAEGIIFYCLYFNSGSRGCFKVWFFVSDCVYLKVVIKGLLVRIFIIGFSFEVGNLDFLVYSMF